MKRLGFTRSAAEPPGRPRTSRPIVAAASAPPAVRRAAAADGADRRRRPGRRADPHAPGRRRRRVALGAAAHRQAAVRHLLRDLPRRQPAGCARPRAEPDRCRRGGGVLPGVHRPDAGDARRGPSAAQRRRSSTRRRSTRSAPTCRPTVAAPPWCATPTAASRCSRCAATTWAAAATCSGSTAPPATTSPARAAHCRRASTRPTWRGQRAADLHRDADRPAEHAEVLRPAAVLRREEGHHRLRQDGTEERRPGGYGLGGFGPAPEGMAMWIIGMVAVIGVALWIGARS